MAKHPGIRQSDLSAALAGVTAAGLKPRRIAFTRDGGFTFDFDGADVQPANDPVADFLTQFEVTNGDG